MQNLAVDFRIPDNPLAAGGIGAWTGCDSAGACRGEGAAFCWADNGGVSDSIASTTIKP